MNPSKMAVQAGIRKKRPSTVLTGASSAFIIAMSFLDLRLSFGSKHRCGAMVGAAPIKLMLLSCMLQHLVFTVEFLFTIAFKALIFVTRAVNGCKMPLEVALLPERLFVGAARLRAD
jgi:hypothetical protein